jgi:hypothetical protein
MPNDPGAAGTMAGEPLHRVSERACSPLRVSRSPATLSLSDFQNKKIEPRVLISIKTEKGSRIDNRVNSGCHRWIAALRCATAMQRTDGW